MVDSESGIIKFALLGVGQGVPPKDIVNFANILRATNNLDSGLSEAQKVVEKIHGGNPGFNLLEDTYKPGSQAFLRTDFIQPATIELCLEAYKNARLKHESKIIKPVCFAGHSLGSVFAAYMAGSIQDSQSLREISAFRGKVVQEEGAKYDATLYGLLGLSSEAVKDILPSYAKIALENAPDYIVVGSLKANEAEFISIVKRAGARIIPLRTPVAFHVEQYMGSTAKLMEKFLKDYEFADISDDSVFIANSDGRPIISGKEIKHELIVSPVVPVRYVDVIHTIRCIGVKKCIAVGPGDGLLSLNAKNGIPQENTHHISDYLPKAA